jgi:hypothetical protein
MRKFYTACFFKNYLIVMFASGFFLSTVQAQVTVTIGAGSQTGTQANSATGDCGPMYRSTNASNFVYSRHHYLYTASELSAAAIPAGTLITKLAWNKDNSSATNSPCTFQIWIRNSSLTTVGAAGQLWADLINGSTLVYDNSAHNVLDPAAWQEITLSTPFLYTGGALEVSVNFDISAGTNPWTTAGFSWKKDPLNDRTLSYVGSTAPGTTLPNLRTVRPQIQMTYTSAGPCTAPPNAGSATASPSTPICSGTTVQLGLTGHTTGTGQTYVWQSSSSFAGPYIDISTSSTSPNFSVSPSATTWYKAAVTCSGNTQVSAPIEVVVNPAFPGGTYTINSGAVTGGTNFQTFADAVAALSCGISGPVVFNVATGSGPYTEQISIPQIGGASAVNTITFNGNNATIQATPTTTDRHIIRLNGADYVTFKKLSIVAVSGSTFGWGIHLTNGADNNKIDSCTIDISTVSSTTQSNSAGIVASGSTTVVTTDGSASFNTISNNTIIGAYQGIIMNGATGSLNSTGNVITKNIIQDFYANGIELTDNDGTVVSFNDVSRSNRTAVTTFTGIELGIGNKNCVVNSNRIHDTHNAATTQTGIAYGIHITGADAAAGSENKVINNLVYNFNSGSGTQYGLANTGSDGAYYYHNTVVLDNASSTAGITRGFYQTTLATRIEVKNNIFLIARGGTGIKYCLYFNVTTSTITSNNNVLYNTASAGTNGIGFYSTGFATLLDWQGANGSIYDQQSLSVDPAFANPGAGDFYPNNPLLDNAGVGVGVSEDIVGVVRDPISPVPGAYEILAAVGVDVGAQQLLLPVNKSCYSSSETVTVTIRNYSASSHNFVTNPVTVNVSVTGPNATTFTPVVVNTGSLPANATLDVLISNNYNMSVAGTYNFSASTTIASDVNANNNAMPVTDRTVAALFTGIASSAPQSYCVTGGTPTISLAGNAGANAIQWQTSASAAGPWNNVGTNNTSYTPASPISGTTYYRAYSTCSGNSDTSNVVEVELNNPQVLTTTNGVRCGPGTVTLSATGSVGATLKWYDQPTGGSSLGTGTTFITPVISTNTTYYVSAEKGGGGAGQLSALPLNGGNGCGGGAMFNVTPATNINIDGFIANLGATSGTSVAVGIWYKTGTYLGSETTQAAWTFHQTVTVTAAGPNNPSTITINPLPLSGGQLYAVFLNADMDYTDITGATIFSNADVSIQVGAGLCGLFTGLNANRGFNGTIFYTAGCASPRTAVLATVNPSPAFSVSPDATVCNDAITALSVTSTLANFDSYTWSPAAGLFTDAAATIPYTGTSASTVYAKITTAGLHKYYANANNSISLCANIDSISLTVLPASLVISASPAELCVSGSTTLSIPANVEYGNATYQWYSSPDGITYSIIGGATNSNYITPVISATTYYKIEIKNSTGSVCLQPIKMVAVNSPQVTGTTAASRCGPGTLTLAATGSAGSTLNWYTAPIGGSQVGTGATFTTPVLNNTTTYYVGASQGGGGNVNVGLPAALSTATSGAGTTNFGLVFDAFAPFTLQSVVVYPISATANLASTVTIDVIDGSNAILHTATVNVIGNPVASTFGQTVNLNFNIQPGTNLKLRPGSRGTGITGLLFEPSAAAPSGNYGYPFDVPGVLSIRTSTLTAGPTNTARNDLYYYFYNWQVSTGCESARTAVVAAVNPNTVVTADPTNQTECLGGNATFTVTAAGGALTYQWRKGGVNINGATSASYTITGVVAGDVGSYDVVVSGDCGAPVTSAAATLALNPATSITTQPTAQSACLGGDVTFNVAATGTGTLTYQWRKAGNNISGATSSSYTITGITAGDVASYDVVVTGDCGPVTSASVALAINAATAITNQPTAQFGCIGGNATFSVTATGTGTLTYQWRKAGNNITGATSSSYTLTNLTAGDAANYDVVVTGTCGSITSASVALTINPVTTITGQPVSQSVCVGGNVTFSVTATGVNLTYQWRKAGNNISGATSSSYTITGLVAGDAGNYDVVVTGICAALNSSTVTLTVNAAGTWLGTVNNNWNTAGNWCGGIPTSTTDVIIPATAPNMPNLSSANGAARNISIANGATLTIGAGGILDLYANISGAGVFNATAGSITFRGATAQTVPAFTAVNVMMNGAGGVTPGGNTTITGALTLINGNITLGSNNLTLNNTSTGSAASHIITNGTGNVVVAGLAASQARTVPVGPDATSYNPATLAANAAHVTDNFTVRVQQGVFENGISGTTYTTHVANSMWIINEATVGSSNVNVTLQWAAAQELTSFDRTRCYVMQHNGTAWSQGIPTTATGTDPYAQTKLNVTSFSPFAVETQRIPRPLTGIYPNPTSDVLNVVTDLLSTGPVVFKVYDAKGREVYRRQETLTVGLNQTTLNLTGLSAGVYIIRVSTRLNENFLVQRFLKVN